MSSELENGTTESTVACDYILMSKFYPAHVAHESFGAGAQKLSARAIYRIPYTASPNHVLWLHPIEQLKHIPLTRELNNFMEYVQVSSASPFSGSSVHHHNFNVLVLCLS